MSGWISVLAAAAICYAFKVAGHTVPPEPLERPRVAGVIEVLPVALLASLVVLQTFSSGSELTVDARGAGLAVAIVALTVRAPFIVVVVAAAATAAGLRALGWP